MADKKYNNDGPSAADKALERFTELMIEKIQTLQGDCMLIKYLPKVVCFLQNAKKLSI